MRWPDRATTLQSILSLSFYDGLFGGPANKSHEQASPQETGSAMMVECLSTLLED